jgi:uncharacterized protein YdaU (DUF1376 family)
MKAAIKAQSHGSDQWALIRVRDYGFGIKIPVQLRRGRDAPSNSASFVLACFTCFTYLVGLDLGPSRHDCFHGIIGLVLPCFTYLVALWVTTGPSPSSRDCFHVIKKGGSQYPRVQAALAAFEVSETRSDARRANKKITNQEINIATFAKKDEASKKEEVSKKGQPRKTRSQEDAATKKEEAAKKDEADKKFEEDKKDEEATSASTHATNHKERPSIIQVLIQRGYSAFYVSLPTDATQETLQVEIQKKIGMKACVQVLKNQNAGSCIYSALDPRYDLVTQGVREGSKIVLGSIFDGCKGGGIQMISAGVSPCTGAGQAAGSVTTARTSGQGADDSGRQDSRAPSSHGSLEGFVSIGSEGGSNQAAAQNGSGVPACEDDENYDGMDLDAIEGNQDLTLRDLVTFAQATIIAAWDTATVVARLKLESFKKLINGIRVDIMRNSSTRTRLNQ